MIDDEDTKLTIAPIGRRRVLTRARPLQVSCGNERQRTGAVEWTWAGSKDPGCQSAPWQLYRQTEPGRRHRGTCVQLPNCILYLPAAWLTTGLLHGAAHPGTSTARIGVWC